VTGDTGEAKKKNIMVGRNTATGSIFEVGGMLGDSFDRKR